MATENINPWVHIWVKPRATLRHLLETHPKKIILFLAIISGIAAAFHFGLSYGYTPRTEYHSFYFYLILVIGGAILGILNLFFSSWLLSLTGSWVGGKGNFTDVKCAIGWSLYPGIIASVFAILQTIYETTFWISAIFSLLYATCLIWSLILFFKLLGEAHRFSVWKALLAFLIAMVLIFVVFVIGALILPLLSPLFK